MSPSDRPGKEPNTKSDPSSINPDRPHETSDIDFADNMQQESPDVGVPAIRPDSLEPAPERTPATPPSSAPGTTTHAGYGEGRPRLIFKVGEVWDGTQPKEFELLEGTTTIGSGSDMDLRLEGLSPLHATIRHTDDDEYLLLIVTDDASIPVLGDPGTPGPVVLRTGAPVELGTWALSYYRDEFADHGRPYGGREGGEGEHQPEQPGR